MNQEFNQELKPQVEEKKHVRACDVCTYSSVTKKRGPKKGYKDTLMQRIESLESILNPLNKQTSLDATYQWASGQKDAGAVSNPNIFEGWHNQEMDSQPIESPDPLKFLENLLGGTGAHGQPYVHAHSNISQHGSPANDTRKKPKSQVDAPIDPNEEEFELHLIRLGLQYCGLTTNYRLSLLLGENYSIHKKNIHGSLRVALCSVGIFYSKHPYLLSLFKTGFGNTINGEDSRQKIVEMYLSQAEKMVPTTFTNEIELIDAIRALLIIEETYFAIEKHSNAVRVAVQHNKLIKEHNLFAFIVFNPLQYSLGPSVDDYKIEIEGSTVVPKAPNLSDAEVKERFSLWQECLAVDTFVSMLSGEAFFLDETEYSEIFRNPALDFSKIGNDFQHPVHFPRLCKIQKARNSIWADSPMDTCFDESREMTAVAALHYSAGIIKFRIPMLRLIRRALRYVRELKAGSTHRYLGDSATSIHNALISQYEVLPTLFTPFKSLEIFVNGSDISHLCINSVWRSLKSFNHDLLIYFSAFCYLHLPIVASNTRYKLSSTSMESYTSLDILMTVLRATVFQIRAHYTPVKANQSLFMPQSYNSTILPINIHQLDPERLSPGLASIHAAVAIYIIATSAIVGCRTCNNGLYAVEAESLIRTWVYPAINRIAEVKPMANKYYSKLKKLVDN
ncbi:hypothetical protein HDV02_004092 [Globomyces sp. JEL0801]|nr:hypothetical protein HDV02_004092 [Globomyces sp. JEL0801]